METTSPMLSQPSSTIESLQSFRCDKYKIAIDTHKHYDTISTSVIAGIAALPLGVLSIKWPSFIPYYKWVVPALFFIFETLLLLLYLKLSWYATIARNTAAALEISDGPGVSQVLKEMSDQEPYRPTTGYEPFLSIKQIICAATGLILFVAAALFLFACA